MQKRGHFTASSALNKVYKANSVRFLVEPFQKTVLLALGLITRERFYTDRMNTIENALLYVGIDLFQAFDQFLDFATFADIFCAAPGAILGALLGVLLGHFRHAAGTLDKLKRIIIAPIYYIIFMNAIHGANERHPLEILAAQFGHHPLKVIAVEHTKNGRLDNVRKMVSQRNFVAP